MHVSFFFNGLGVNGFIQFLFLIRCRALARKSGMKNRPMMVRKCASLLSSKLRHRADVRLFLSIDGAQSAHYSNVRLIIPFSSELPVSLRRAKAVSTGHR